MMSNRARLGKHIVTSMSSSCTLVTCDFFYPCAGHVEAGKEAGSEGGIHVGNDEDHMEVRKHPF